MKYGIQRSVLVCATSLLLAACNPGGDAAPPAARPALTVEIVMPAREMLPATATANGVISAWQEAIVGPEVSGLRIVELHANVGDSVRKDQTLAILAHESVENEVRQARAALAEATVAAAEAKANGDRVRTLQGTGLFSAQSGEQVIAREQADEARVESAQAQLAAAQLRLRHTVLKAPDDGIISSRRANVGAVPMAGEEMFRLIRRGRLEWRGEFTATELEKIRAGQPAQVLSPGGTAWNGKVRQVAPTLDAATRLGLVYVDLTTPATPGAAPMRPGAWVRGEITLGRQEGLVVPPSAVVAGDGFHQVFVVDDQRKVHARKVRLGRLAGDKQEILEGVQAGDRLVASGGAFLGDGDTVLLAADAAAMPATSPAATRH